MEPEDIPTAILAGDCDGLITDIVAALREHQRSGAVELCWRVAFDDLVIDEENLTVNEAKIIEAATGESVLALPVARSAKNIAAVIAAGLMERVGMTSAEAFKAVGSRSLRDLMQAVTEYAIVDPPKGPSGLPTPATSQAST